MNELLYPLNPTIVVIAAGALLAVATFLRVLAIHREQEITRHDMAREIRRLRKEHHREADSKDEITV